MNLEIKKIKDYNLWFLILMCFFNIIFMFIFGIDNKIRYLLLILNFLPIIFCKKDKMLPSLFFVQANAGLYDEIGFKWIFNISIVIVVIRKLLIYHEKIDKKTFILFLIFAFYEFILLLFNNTNNQQYFSFISWLFSYILLIMSINEKKNSFIDIYKYFSIGFIFSFLCGLAYPISEWRFNWPTAFRYVGMLRDANYYSMNALLLIFGAGTYEKLTQKNGFVRIILFSILGFMSISKMFILVLIGGLILRNMIVRDRKINLKKIFIIFIAMIFLIILAYKIGLLNLIYEKYIYRTERTTLTTGRNVIQKYYIEKLLYEPSVLFFGKGINYNQFLGLGHNGYNVAFKNFVAHNTILDLLLASGIIGTFVYICFLFSIFNRFKKLSKKENEKEFICIATILFFMLFALSMLMNDAFAIFILYINILRNVSLSKTV